MKSFPTREYAAVCVNGVVLLGRANLGFVGCAETMAASFMYLITLKSPR